jgi:hypothetical protein
MQEPDLYSKEIFKRVKRSDKCINEPNNYAEKKRARVRPGSTL